MQKGWAARWGLCSEPSAEAGWARQSCQLPLPAHAASGWNHPLHRPSGEEKDTFGFFPGVCYFLVVVITDRAQRSSATPGRVAGDILQWWVPRVAKCLLVKWKEYRWLTFWLRHPSQTAAYVSQKTVTCFFSPFSYFYRPENPATSKRLKTLN